MKQFKNENRILMKTKQLTNKKCKSKSDIIKNNY